MKNAITFSVGLAVGLICGLVVAAVSGSARLSSADAKCAELRASLQSSEGELSKSRARLTAAEKARDDLEYTAALNEGSHNELKGRVRLLNETITKLKGELAAAKDTGKPPAQPVAAIGPLAAPSPKLDAADGGIKFYATQLAAITDSCVLKGTAVNKSDVDYQVALFDVSLYDSQGELIDVAVMSIANFPAGQSRDFSEEFYNRDSRRTSRAASFKIVFKGGL